MNYKENEIKILDITVLELCKKIEKLGASKVFDDDRTFTTFDRMELPYLEQDILIRLTEEEKLKLSVSKNTSKSSTGEKETIKVFVSRKQEMIDFFNAIGIVPISEVKSHRISYEWKTSKGVVDFDIDIFPLIPPFLEIDIENLDIEISDLLKLLGISNNKIVNCGTEQIYQMFGINYYKEFSI